MPPRPDGSAAKPGGAEPVRGTRSVLPLVENVGESTAACLLAMVQGNLLILSASHWAVASQTGIIAGLAATAALVVSGAKRRGVVAILLGAVTAVVDYFVHPGMLGPEGVEALVTGAVAALLSYGVGTLLAWVRGTEGRDTST